MARLLLIVVAIGLIIFLVRALRQKPRSGDGKLPPPRDRDDDAQR